MTPPNLESTNSSNTLPVGQWPTPTPRWGLYLTGALWLAWLGFLIWMMILRINTTPV